MPRKPLRKRPFNRPPDQVPGRIPGKKPLGPGGTSAQIESRGVIFTICEIHYNPSQGQQGEDVQWEYFKVHYTVVGEGGCTDQLCPSYNPLATDDDGSCEPYDECGECGGPGAQNECYDGSYACAVDDCPIEPESCEDQGLVDCPDGSCAETLDDCSGTCFPAGTKITKFNDTEINIEDIEIGDKVKSWNEDINKIGESKVIKLKQPIHNDMIKLTFGDK